MKWHCSEGLDVCGCKGPTSPRPPLQPPHQPRTPPPSQGAPMTRTIHLIKRVTTLLNQPRKAQPPTCAQFSPCVWPEPSRKLPASQTGRTRHPLFAPVDLAEVLSHWEQSPSLPNPMKNNTSVTAVGSSCDTHIHYINDDALEDALQTRHPDTPINNPTPFPSPASRCKSTQLFK